MEGLLLLLSFVAVLAGLLFTSQATMGVAIIGVGVALAAWSRIAQASNHHKAVMKAMNKEETKEDS